VAAGDPAPAYGISGVTLRPNSAARVVIFHSGLITQGLARGIPPSLSYWRTKLCLITSRATALTKSARASAAAVRRQCDVSRTDGARAGSDALGSMSTTAQRDGDHYVLNAAALHHNGSVADILLIYARTDKSLGARISASSWNAHGRFRGRTELDKMDFAAAHGRLVFDDCIVPPRTCGPETRASQWYDGLDLERAIVAMINVECGACIRAALDYAKTASSSAADREFQLVQAKPRIVTTIKPCDFCYRTLAKPTIWRSVAAAR